MIAVYLAIFTFLYTSVNLLLVALRNKRAQQFFKTKAPKLPVLPDPHLFSGHFLQVTYPDKNWKIISQLHDKYGPSFGFYMCNQAWVCTKDVDLLKHIEVEQASCHINRSKFGLPFEEFNNSIFQLDDDNWRQVRRAIAPALTNHKVRSDEVVADIKHILGQLSRALRKKMDRSRRVFKQNSILVDVHDTFQRYTLAVIFLMTYKRDGDIDFDADQDHWVEQMKMGARHISNPIVAISIMFPFLRPLCRLLIQFHTVGRLQERIIDYIVEATDINRHAREQHDKFQRRLSMTTGNQTSRRFEDLARQGAFKRRLVDTIIDAYVNRKIVYDHFIGSTLFLLLAGFETTADTISCLIWHLAHQPQVQDKLRQTILEEGVDADYVCWCIYETIRWHPPVPLGTGRVLGSDVTVNGLFLPKGTFVMPSTHTIHHDPTIWPDPDRFKPERWAEANSFHPAAFMGFGLGPRNCVGGKLAIHEIKLVLELILTEYTIERCSETSQEYNFSAHGLLFTVPDQPIKVKFVARYPN